MDQALVRIYAVVALYCLGFVNGIALYGQEAVPLPQHSLDSCLIQDVPLPSVPPAALPWNSPTIGNEHSKVAKSVAQVDTSSNSLDLSSDKDARLDELQRQVDKLVRAEQERVQKASQQPTAKLTAQLQPDFYWFDQAPANRAAVGDLQDGSAFRRARIGVLGDYGPSQYRIEFDWALANRPTFLDVWAGLTDVADIDSIRVGHFFEPFSLERVTPNRFTVFLERSLIDSAFVPARNLGVMAQSQMQDELGNWAIGIFRTNSDGFGDDSGDFGERAVTGRANRQLWYDDSGDSLRLVHIGGAYSFRDADNRLSRFRSQPEARVGSIIIGNVPAFVDTGNIPTNHFQLFGLEAAWVEGAFSTQAEYIWAPIDVIGDSNALMQGWYGQVSYFLTGEHRPYKQATGTFERVVPHRSFARGGQGGLLTGPGAWEVAARVSFLDLNDESIAGGELTDLTCGTNWYLNPFLHLSFNYIHAFLNRVPIGNSDADIFALRASYDF